MEEEDYKSLVRDGVDNAARILIQKAASYHNAVVINMQDAFNRVGEEMTGSIGTTIWEDQFTRPGRRDTGHLGLHRVRGEVSPKADQYGGGGLREDR